MGHQDWLFFLVRQDVYTLPPFLPPSLASPRSPPLWLLEATAGSLLPLRLDVVVYLELGLVWLLCRSVLQLPGGDRERQEVAADAGGGGCVGCSTDWASELDKMRERERENCKESSLKFHQNASGLSRLAYLLIKTRQMKTEHLLRYIPPPLCGHAVQTVSF